MEKTHFNVSAEILQRNATKASIRDLNAEFQMKGGKVTYKTSKKGDNYRLSHPDPEYLEEFRVKLFVELGLMEKKDIPPAKKEEREAPRYGDEHKLRRGWNVRSPKEFKEGKYNRDEKRGPEGSPWDKWKESRGRRDVDDRKSVREHDAKKIGAGKGIQGRPPSSDFFRKTPRNDDLEKHFEKTPNEEIAKTYKERWEDIPYYMEIVENALKDGAVDDGQIIKHAYDSNIPPEKIKTLKKMLWDNRCRGPRKYCPHGKKKFRFEDLMKVASGEIEGWEKIDSPLVRFVDMWKNNMEKMYGGLEDRVVRVRGKVSTYKAVMRKKNEHLKILVYDTIVKPEGGDKERDTRKLWVKINRDEFEELTSGADLRIDDMISLTGKCVFDNYFNDYWIVDLTKLKVITPSTDGEKIQFGQ